VYSVKVRCSNCGYEDYIDIPDGELIEKQNCPVCGCHTIEKSWDAIAHRKQC